MGKTQFGMQLAVDVQLPLCFGGVGGAAVYIGPWATHSSLAHTDQHGPGYAFRDQCAHYSLAHTILSHTRTSVRTILSHTRTSVRTCLCAWVTVCVTVV
jgi:hypothetical protein